MVDFGISLHISLVKQRYNMSVLLLEDNLFISLQLIRRSIQLTSFYQAGYDRSAIEIKLPFKEYFSDLDDELLFNLGLFGCFHYLFGYLKPENQSNLQ